MAKKFGRRPFRKNSITSGDAVVQAVPKKSHKKLFVIVGAVVAVMVVSSVGYQVYYRYFGPAFVIDGQKYSRKDLKAVQTDAAKYKLSTNDAKDYYVKVSRQQQAAKKLGVDVSADVLITSAIQFQDLISIAPLPDDIGYSGWSFNNPKLNKYLYLKIYEAGLKNELLTERDGGYKGVVYNFPFSRNEFKDPNNKDAQNPEIMASDRAYAEDAAKQYHDQLKNKSIDPLVAADKINADARLTFGYSANNSGPFTITKDGISYQGGEGSARNYDNTLDKLRVFKEPGLGDTYTIKGLYSTPIDLAFSFVQVNKIMQPRKDLPTDYTKAYNQQKVNVYVK